VSYTVSELKEQLEQIPPAILVELILDIVNPSSIELVEAFDRLIDENIEAIEEELPSYW